MRGFLLGKWYAKIMESTRLVGQKTISVHEFTTESERDTFVNDYNQVLLTHNGITPDTYRMATEPNHYVIYDFLRGVYLND